MTRLNARIPEGPVADKWTAYKSGCKLVNPNNKRKLDIIVVGTGLAGPLQPPLSESLATMSRHSAIRIHRAVLTASLHRVESMPQRTMPTTVTVPTGFFMTPLKAAITGRVKPMFTVSLKSATRLSTSVLPRVCLLPVSMAGF